jgi:hypothetical protein
MGFSPRVALQPDRLTAFCASLQSGALRPGDAGYEQARAVHNAMIDRRPAVIARCAGVSDVMRTIEFARQNELPMTIRAGGRHVAGHSVRDGGVMLDLRPMKGIRVQPKARRVRAQAGVTWEEFDRETQVFGLAATGGVVGATGVAASTLGGGIGRLMRKYGLSCDNLISADMVTADGRFVQASADEATDLFWGLRGGGGNFGVVTSLQFELHPVGEVYGGMLLHSAKRAGEFLRLYRDLVSQAPDDFGSHAVLVALPDGTRAVGVIALSTGTAEAGERIVAPFRRFAVPLLDGMGVVSYSAVQAIAGRHNPPGFRNYWKSSFLRALSDGAIETLTEFAAIAPSPRTQIVIEHMGGKVARIGRGETAFDCREAPFNFGAFSVWEEAEDDERNIAWTRAFCEAMQPFSEGSVYVNYMGDAADEGPFRSRAGYGDAKRRRLTVLKKKYDPDNVFRFNHNIAPQ